VRQRSLPRHAVANRAWRAGHLLLRDEAVRAEAQSAGAGWPPSGPRLFGLRRQPMACRLQRSGIRRISSSRGRANRRSRHRSRPPRPDSTAWVRPMERNSNVLPMQEDVDEGLATGEADVVLGEPTCPRLPRSSDRSTSWRPGGRRR